MVKILIFLISFYPTVLKAQIPLKDLVPVLPARDLVLLIPPNDPMYLTVNKNITLGSNTVVRIKLLQEVSSKLIKEGDTINFSVFEAVTIDKQIVIKAGALLTGTIEKAVQAKGLGKAGELNFSLNYVKAIDGTKIYLKPSKANIEGKNRAGAAVALGAINPLFLLHKGKNAKIEEGEIIEAYADRNYIIQVVE